MRVITPRPVVRFEGLPGEFTQHDFGQVLDDLSSSFRAGRLAEALSKYTQPGVLVVDEVGYLTYGADAANMLFHVVNDRHRRKRAMIFTTNKPVSTWGAVLHDDDLALAIVDRVLERGRLLTLDGPFIPNQAPPA